MAEDKGKVGGGTSGLGVLIVIMILFSLWMVNHNGNKTSFVRRTGESSRTSQSKTAESKNISSDKKSSTVSNEDYSQYHGLVRLQSGTARSAYQPNQEYIIISAHGNETPINIGGWTLENGQGNKRYVAYGQTFQGQSSTAKIPLYGIPLYDPYHPLTNRRAAITLKSGERAVITTGLPPVFAKVSIKDNFKVNRCLGYLEDDNNYKAYPRLSYHCPSINNEIETSFLDDTCYSFVRSIRSCHTPKYVAVKDKGDCLDRNCEISSSCRNFVISNYNIDSCFRLFSNDEDFVAPEWRVFLSQTWELWGKSRDSISLYDRSGHLVDQISY